MNEFIDVNYNTETGLENLTRRLRKGQILKGRIIDVLDQNGYLLRIYGYNILTKSTGIFKKFEEIEVEVVDINPHIVFNLISLKVSHNAREGKLDIKL